MARARPHPAATLPAGVARAAPAGVRVTRRDRPPATLAAALLVGVVAATALAAIGLVAGSGGIAALSPSRLALLLRSPLVQHPALPADVSATPLARPEAAPPGTGGYRFLGLEDDGSGRPVRWDPCRPIHVVVRPAGAPPGGRAAVAAAISTVQRVTGLRLTVDGTTTETPRANRSTMDVARYGRRWSPVLIAWTDPREYPRMAGYAGLGGPDAVSGSAPGTRRYVTGVVLLNRDYLARVAGWPDGARQLRAVVLHEFGHLAGLDHVDDPRQLMYRRPAANAGYGPGDVRGLVALSAGPCFRDF